MEKIVEEAEPFERFERPVAEAREFVADMGQEFKVEHIDDELKQVPDRSASTARASSSTCAAGRTFRTPARSARSSCCRIAGAYWKNDADRKQLQRLYGTAFFDQKDLDAYLDQVEEAKKRDHRVLGKQLKLFTISQLVGSGLILWMPKGAIVRGILETFIKDELVKRGYSAGLHPAHRPAGAVPHQRPLPVLPRCPVPADDAGRRLPPGAARRPDRRVARATTRRSSVLLGKAGIPERMPEATDTAPTARRPLRTIQAATSR